MENYTNTEIRAESGKQVVSDNSMIFRMSWNTQESCRIPLPSLENPRVDGSIPPLATKQNKGLHWFTTGKPFCFV